MPHQGTYSNHKIHPTGVLALYTRLGHEAPMIPNNITSLRRLRGMTQTELAEAIGTKLSMMGKLERGERDLSADWIEKIASALDVEPFQLIAPERLFPTEEQLADMLQLAQQQIPAGLPYSEWPKAVAAGLHMRLLKLADDRASAASADACA